MDNGQPSASAPSESETVRSQGRACSDPGTDTLTDATEEAQAQAQARDADALRCRFRALRRAVSPYSDRELYVVRARHELMKTVLDGALTVSKLPPDLRDVVDVGCGFGPWATDMARRFPGARVTGTDLAPIAPAADAAAAAANLRFVVADANAPWAFAAPASLDLVHMRALTETIADWPFALGQAFRALRPGGLVEINELRPIFFDFDGQFAVTAVFPELLDMYLQLAAGVGIDLDPIPKLPGWLNDAGFEKIAQRSEILPLGLWPKDGKLRKRAELYTDLMMSGGWESKTRELFLSGGWDTGRFTALMDEVKADTRAAKTKIYVTVVITTCRKPAAE